MFYLDDEETGGLMKVQFEAYAQSLPTCVNRDLIDKVSISVCECSGGLSAFFKVILYSYLLLKKMKERITDS